jgi:prevent-host-death family protein
MITSVRSGKAKFSELIDRASRGEEIIITVHGKPKARIVPISSSDSGKGDKSWPAVLREARSRYSTGKSDSSGKILDHIRGDRM